MSEQLVENIDMLFALSTVDRSASCRPIGELSTGGGSTRNDLAIGLNPSAVCLVRKVGVPNRDIERLGPDAVRTLEPLLGRVAPT